MPVAWIQKDRGGTLRYQLARRIASANTPQVTLLTSSGTELVAEQAATKGPRTTLDAAAASGQRTIPLTATDNVKVGHIYRLTNSGGQYEFVTVDAISSGVSVTARRDLRHTYASADVFESQEVSVSVTAEEAPSVRYNCRAKWRYTDTDSQEHVEESIFHVSAFAPVHNVTAEDIARRYPRIYDALGDPQKLQELIDEIWENEVLQDLAGAVSDEHGFVSGGPLRLALIERVAAQVESANEQWDDFDRRMTAYQLQLEQAIQSTPIDTDEDGDVDSGDEKPLHPWSYRMERA